MLLDQERTSVRLVLTPERVVAAETRRTLTALALQGVRVDGVVVNRLVPDVGDETGTAADWLRRRRAEQEAVLTEVRESTDVPVRVVPHVADEPVGLPRLGELALALYGADDPLAGAPPTRLISVWREDDEGDYLLRLAVPLAAEAALDLARVGDELVVTVDGRRRLVDLPSVLRRCQVVSASAGPGGLTVRFRPDPRLWMR
ncbi:ArsA family ATPase [Actinoalloteichus caeruleus]|uniref:ArsA family ATPase n=1 Tax=Actinoalloteichus cyanogriseus TaxID=2893586 RepID=UPI0027E3268C|nr:ArsA-related P-loop ATPase [Actinoalloteichus caeruleus]